MSTDGAMKLSKQGVVAFSAMLHSGRKPKQPPNPNFQAWAKQLEASGQQIPRCEYGPVRFVNDAPDYDVHWLWRKTAPSDLYDRLEEGEVLGELRLNLAPADCPTTSNDARSALDEARRKASGEHARAQQDRMARERAQRDAQYAAKKAEREAASREHQAQGAAANKAAAIERQKVAKAKYCDALDASVQRLREQVGPTPRPAQAAHLQRTEARVAAQCKA